MSHKQNKQRKETPKSETRLSHAWRWISGTATILGFAGLVTFLPKPIVSIGGPIDPAWLLTAPVTIRNAGMIPLADVSADLDLGQIVTNNGIVDRKSIPTFRTRFALPKYWTGHYLSMDESFGVVPDTMFHVPNVTFADIAISVVYRPWFMPFHREKTFRFTTVRQLNGHLDWISESLGRPALGPNLETPHLFRSETALYNQSYPRRAFSISERGVNLRAQLAAVRHAMGFQVAPLPLVLNPSITN